MSPLPSNSAITIAEAAQRIRTVRDFASVMTMLMASLAAGEMDPATGNAICKTAGTLLKAVEMQMKLGVAGAGGEKQLFLTEATVSVIDPKPVVAKAAVAKAAEPKLTKTPAAAQLPGKKGGPWCNDCYIKRSQYVTATETDDGDDLCLPCFNAR